MPTDPFCLLTIRVQPRSSRNQFEFRPDGVLKVWTTAPPVEGEANAAVCAALAKALKIPKSAITVVSGETGRNKKVRIDGLSEDSVRGLLAN